MKENVVIKQDVMLLDTGSENRNPFVLVTGVEVDDTGSLVDKDLASKAMASEAVQRGATRINNSDCVDLGGDLSPYNDEVVVFNGGDVYEPYDGAWARNAVQEAGYAGADLVRALDYINHRENRYDFLVANGVFEPVHTIQEAKQGFLDEVRDFLGL